MAFPAPSHVYFPEHELKLLVDMVRLSRVTLLIAEQHSDKSGFLQSTLMPLLSSEAPSGKPEIAVLFDAWDEPPLPALQARIQQLAGAAAVPPPDAGSLAASLSAWQEALGVTFLIIFDRFEEYLRQSPNRARVSEFEESFVEVVKDPALRANFLLALDEQAEPLLARLESRIPGFSDARVRLPRARYAASARANEQKGPMQLYRTGDAAPVRPREPIEAFPPPLPSQADRALFVTDGTASGDGAEPQRKSESSIVAAAEVLALHAQQKAAAAKTRGRAAKIEPPAAPPSIVTGPPPEIVESERPAPAQEREASIAPLPPVEQPPVQLEPVETSIAQAPPQQPSSARPAAVPRRRAPRFAWAPLLLVPVAALIFWQYKSQEDAEPVASAPAHDTAAVSPRDVPASEPKQSVATPAAPRAIEPAPTRSPAPQISSAQVSPGTASPARSAGPEAAPKALPAPPDKAAPRAPAVAPPSAEVATAKSASAASARPISPPPAATQPVRKPEAAIAKPVAEKPTPSLAAGPATAQRLPKADIVATAPPAVPGPRASSEAPSAPVLRIHVQSESQRAMAERLIGPLKERGIQVTGIVVGPRGADAAHIRYYDLTGRNEAMKVAVALRDLGISAQQLKHMPAPEAAEPTRRYELWLPEER